jgi:outer membrane protein assembly factor BamA
MERGLLICFRIALFLYFFGCAIGNSAWGQAIRSVQRDTVIVPVERLQTAYITMGRIIIIGNKVTRERIILRELSLKSGDTLATHLLLPLLIRDRNKIYNLRLFNNVSIRVLDLGVGQIDLLIEVTERFYTEPNPLFELSDRNLNEWWTNYNHDFSRINYGIRLKQKNFRGRNETLQFTAQFGFTRKFDLSYRIPNLDKQQKHGLSFGLNYSEPRNLAYQTNDHVLSFVSKNRSVKINRGASIGYAYRKSFYETHGLLLEYMSSSILDTVLVLNPNFYKNGADEQRFFALSYSFNAEHRDVIAYPLKGYQFTFSISKSGLFNDVVNQFEVNSTLAKHWPLKNDFFLSNFSAAYLSTPTVQPYSLFSALGYRGQIVRGYEIYVIEGPRFMLNKTTLKKRIFQRSWRVESMPMEQFRYFPLSIYLKGFTDLGYVSNYDYYSEKGMNTRLTSKLLVGAGAGVDIVTFYDFTFRVEYTLTGEGTRGFFVNFKKEF